MSIHSAIKLCVLILSFYFLLACNKVESNLPSDDLLQNVFLAKSPDFEEIKSVVLNNKVYRLALRKGELDMLPENILDKNNKDKILKLLKNNLDIDLVSIKFKKGSYDSINEVSFYSFRSGYVGGGQNKGVAYLVNGVDEALLVNDLDVYRQERWQKDALVSGKRVYKQLIDNWYLFYEYYD